MICKKRPCRGAALSIGALLGTWRGSFNRTLEEKKVHIWVPFLDTEDIRS
jgi:hypothetical protein